jgi:hypothetical protein
VNDTDTFTGEGEYYWHLHHEVLLEKANEPIQNRVDYVSKFKTKQEVDTRLRLMHRAYLEPDMLEIVEEGFGSPREAMNNAVIAREVNRLHTEQCGVPLNCPWNGFTIFPK